MEEKCEGKRVEKREREREVHSQHVWLWHNIYFAGFQKISFSFFFSLWLM
jgi:hypothetical protein